MFKGFTSRGSLRANYLADLVATGTIKRVYTSASNSACAIVTEGVGGVPYVYMVNLSNLSIGYQSNFQVRARV